MASHRCPACLQVAKKVEADVDAAWAVSVMHKLKAVALQAARQQQQAEADARIAQEEARWGGSGRAQAEVQ